MGFVAGVPVHEILDPGREMVGMVLQLKVGGLHELAVSLGRPLHEKTVSLG